MLLSEIFNIVSIDSVQFSPERELQTIKNAKLVDTFNVNDLTIKKYTTSIPVKIVYHIYDSENMVGRIQFDITPVIMFDNKEYTLKTKSVTPHASLMPEYRGKNIVMPIYQDILKSYNLISDKHSIAASKLWDKLGNIKYVTLHRGKLIEVDKDDPRKLFKVIMGSGNKVI